MNYIPNTRKLVRKLFTAQPNISNQLISLQVCQAQNRPFVKLSGTMLKQERQKFQKVFLFTYGTLMSGMNRHQVLQQANATLIGKTSINAKLFTANWSWPFLQLNPLGSSTVKGEVYQIPANLVDTLDHIEGYYPNREDNLFERRTIEVDILPCDKIKAIVYEGGKDLLTLKTTQIMSGDWRAAIINRFPNGSQRS